jgi:hypothetical protein
VTEKTWTTYKRADGELIAGDYGWICDLDSIEADEYDCLELVEQTWKLVGEQVVKIGRLDRWCASCDEDVTLKEPVEGPVYCPKHAPVGEG